jgi:hypothetical protein
MFCACYRYLDCENKCLWINKLDDDQCLAIVFSFGNIVTFSKILYINLNIQASECPIT